jgi:hypothetical protein
MNLIYSLAFGQDHFFTLAQEMVNGIRRVGYTDEVLIITDRPWTFEGARTEVLDMTHAILWKASLFRVVECSQYEKILFLDSDIALVKHPREVFAYEGIRFPHEPLPLGLSGLNSVFLTQAERAQYGIQNGVNAGTFLLPGNQAEGFLRAFEAGWRKYEWGDLPDYWPDNGKYKPQMSDQSALQTMILRGEIAVEFFPETVVGFPGLAQVDPEDVVMLHFCGPRHSEENKAKILSWMRGCGEDPKGVCDLVAREAYKWRGGQGQSVALYEAIRRLSETLVPALDAIRGRLERLERRIQG